MRVQQGKRVESGEERARDDRQLVDPRERKTRRARVKFSISRRLLVSYNNVTEPSNRPSLRG